MTRYTYRVEWEDEDVTHVNHYDGRLSAAVAKARRESVKHICAYVVALDASGAPCGHQSYGRGSVMETDGEGFAP